MLPIFNTDDSTLSLLQTQWAKQLNPLIDGPIATPIILSKVILTSGNNTINHTLGKNLTGWFVIRQRGAGTIYDTQDSNKIPDKTLLLVASTTINVDLLVF